jgi:hypothetical protein
MVLDARISVGVVHVVEAGDDESRERRERGEGEKEQHIRGYFVKRRPTVAKCHPKHETQTC